MCNVSMHYINKNDNTRLINKTISIFPAMKAAMNPQSNKHFMAFFILALSVSSSLSAETTKNVCNKAGNSVKSASERLLNELIEGSKTQTYLPKSLDINGSSAVYGMLQCRGDATLQDCQECSQRARRSLNESCSSGTGSTIWLDLCYLRWGTAKFSGVLDLNGRLISTPKDVPQMASNFRDSAVKLLNDLTSQVMSSFDERRYASRNISQGASPSGSIYGFVQCWNDISKPDCRTCLRNATGTYNTSYIGSPSVRVLKRSCMVMYDPHLFYKPLAGQAVPNAGIADKTPSGGKGKNHIPVILGSSIGSVVLLSLIGFIFMMRKRQMLTKLPQLPSEDRREGESFITEDEPIDFTMAVLAHATNNYSQTNKLGQGGFGSVYKGTLPNGLDIAVKRLSLGAAQGIREFISEIKILAKVQHRNLVNLLGYCKEGNHFILVYEYLPNNSLDKILFNEEKKAVLNWARRYNIIIGVAKGLSYLHEDSAVTIVHRDIKASNILLDSHYNAKISDFGLARLFKDNETHIETSNVAGTRGYCAPEYVVGGQLTTKADIFSFGVLLLEIMSGKRNTVSVPVRSQNSKSSDEATTIQNLVEITWRHFEDGSLREVIDEAIREECPLEQAKRAIQVGLLCTQEDFYRPTMFNVIRLLLENEISLPTPIRPSFFEERSTNTT